MAVVVWLGEPAEEGYEQSALRELAADLAEEAGRFHVFANFAVGTSADAAQIDILVIHEKAFTIVELKHSAGYAVFGGSNGPWKRSDGVEFPGKHNPALQVIKQYSALTRWLQSNCRSFVAPGRAAACSNSSAWSDIRKFIALYPCRNPSSKIDVSSHRGFAETLGGVIGFDVLKDHLLEPKWQGRVALPLTDNEIRAMAGVLGLTDVTASVLAATTEGPAALNSTPCESGAPRLTPPPRAHRRKLLIRLAIAALVCVAGTLALLLAFGGLRNDSPDRPVRQIEATEAWQYIGSAASVHVRIEVGDVNVKKEQYLDRWTAYLFDSRVERSAEHKFSLQIANLPTSQRPFSTGSVIVVGPVVMATAETGEAQVEIGYDELEEIVRILHQ
jgi:hypothetical protein